MSAPLAIVAAIAANGVIGANAGLPFRLPSDLKRFRALTWGKPLLMGRKTYLAIGRPLPGRESVVVTRDRSFTAPGARVTYELDEALALAQARASAMGAEEIIVAGGGEIYAALLPRVARMHLTLVEVEAAGDVRFPEVDWSEWIEAERARPEPQQGDAAPFSYVRYERRRA